MSDSKILFENQLKTVENRIEEIIKSEKLPAQLFDSLDYIMQAGGKRIRPVLALLACGACGSNPNDALNSGVSIEIMHNFTLAHDDIMDRSPIRRNRPTVHVMWDDATAILLGDYMVGLGYDVLIKDAKGDIKRIIDAYSWGLKEVCVGQILDMQFNSQKSVSFNEYLDMIVKKTSRLLQIPLQIGALQAKADDNFVTALDNFGYNLGIAFQIQDDLLDLTADEAELGKHIGQDLLEGKKSYLIVKAQEEAKDAEDQALIAEYFANNGAKEHDIDKYKALFAKLNVFEIAADTANDYYNKALEYISIIPDNEYKECLVWLLNSLKERRK